MHITKTQYHVTHRQSGNSVGEKSNSKQSADSRSSDGLGRSQDQASGHERNLFDSSAGQQSNAQTSSLPFNNPLDDADTLMRAILANYVDIKPGTKQDTHSVSGQTPANDANSDQDKALANITRQFQSRFQDNASDPEAFHALMQKSFGDTYDQAKAEDIRQQTLNGDFSWMPGIKLVDGSTLAEVSGQQTGGEGLGAYSKDNDTIYLSRELLASDPAKAEEILTEEVGHALDARVNTSDAAGDEGDIFSKLLHGEEISIAELTELRSENDSGTIMIDGREVEVEFGWFSKAKNKLKKAVKKVGGAIKKGVEKVGSAIKKGIDNVGDTIKKGIDKVKDVVSDHWKAIKKGFKKIMESELLGKVLMVAQFIPIPIVQVAVRVINIAKAAYSVYQGVKHGSFAMIAGGIAGVAGGAAGLGKAINATGNWVDTAAKVANVAKGAGAAHQIIAEKNLGAAATLASNAFGANSTVATVLNTAVKVDNVVKAAEDGNLFGVVSGGTTLLQDFTGPQGDAFLETINKHTNTIQQIDTARKTGNYAGAIGLVRENFGDTLNIPKGTQETLQRVENGIRYAQTVDRLVDNKDYASAATMLLNTSASNVTNEGTKQNLVSLSNMITKVDNAVVAFEDGRYNDAVGFTAETIGQPLSKKTRQFIDTVQSKANMAESLVKAVKAKDVQSATALLRDLTEGKGSQYIDLIEKAGSAADKVKLIKNAVDKNDFSAAIGLVCSLSEDITGKASPDQVATVQNLVKAVENGDLQTSATLINDLTNGKHSNVLNFIQTADNVVGKAEGLKRAIDSKDFTTAASLANSLSQDINGRALPEQITTAANLINSVQIGNISGSSALLRELTNGKHSQIIDVFDKVGVAQNQVQALEIAIENKDFEEAADIATSLSQMVADSDSKVSNTLSGLSDVLSGKVQVPMNALPGGMTPGISPNAGVTPLNGDFGFNPTNSYADFATRDSGFGDFSLGTASNTPLAPGITAVAGLSGAAEDLMLAQVSSDDILLDQVNAQTTRSTQEAQTDTTESGEVNFWDKLSEGASSVWATGNASFGSLDIVNDIRKGDITEIQAKINDLAAKAEAAVPFSDDEKMFLSQTIEAIAIGGKSLDIVKMREGNYDNRTTELDEAGELMHQYIKGNGKDLEINSDVYTGSSIVQYAMTEIKAEIEKRVSNGETSFSLDSSVVGQTNFGDQHKFGDVRANGVLLTEQSNRRLHFANNRFKLDADVSVKDGKVDIQWRVDDTYDFSSFQEQADRNDTHETEIPVKGGKLIIPDGLLEYATKQGVAVEFGYTSTWSEQITVN